MVLIILVTLYGSRKCSSRAVCVSRNSEASTVFTNLSLPGVIPQTRRASLGGGGGGGGGVGNHERLRGSGQRELPCVWNDAGPLFMDCIKSASLARSRKG